MRLDIDHVVFGGTDLDALTDRFERIGLDGQYGGTHADGTTHMRVVPFRDGSYLELIAPTNATDPTDAGYWPARLAADAGPTAWCLRGEDAGEMACEAVRSGFSVHGPTPGGRTTTDGRVLEWDAVVLDGDAVDPAHGSGTGAAGEALPFVCVDRTPRTWRVPPADAHVAPASGVEAVLLAVEDAGAWTRRFRRLAAIPRPVDVDLPGLDGDAVVFPGTPLVLVEPTPGSDLATRTAELGVGPCGYLLGVDDIEEARRTYPLGETWTVAGRSGAWFEKERGTLGVVTER